MARYLVEVDHDAETAACIRTIRVFLTSGSHFLTHASWGCMDGVHSAWFIMDASSKEEACSVVPPAFRARARVVGLTEFTIEEVEGLLEQHSPGHA